MFKQREGVFVVERRPDPGFVMQALRFHLWVWLAGYVRAPYDLDCDDISGRGSSGADCGKAALTNDRSEGITSDSLALIVREGDWSVDDWTEGGEK